MIHVYIRGGRLGNQLFQYAYIRHLQKHNPEQKVCYHFDEVYQAGSPEARDILSGKEQGPKREIVLLNAGAALYIGKKADSIADGIALAAKTIDSGAAVRTLEAMVQATNA